MTGERLEIVKQILNNFDENNYNYYSLFGINQNMSIDEIKNTLRKKQLKVLFHPDQVGFVPSEYHDKYFKMIEITKDVDNVFSSIENKQKYDEQLKAKSNVNSDYNYIYDLDDDSKMYYAVIATIQKYGFNQALKAIKNYAYSGNVNSFTRDNGARDIMKSISPDAVMNILANLSLRDLNPTLEQMVMNYLTDIVMKDQAFRMQYSAFEQACFSTFQKYDLNGYRGQMMSAVSHFRENGDISRFTNQNNSRTNLENASINTSDDINDVNFYMQCSLNIRRFDNYQYAYQNSKNNLDMMFSTMIYSESIKYQQGYSR